VALDQHEPIGTRIARRLRIEAQFTSKKIAATRSAAEAHDVGWPLPAAVVARYAVTRSWWPRSSRASRRASAGMLTAISVLALKRRKRLQRKRSGVMAPRLHMRRRGGA